MDRLLEIVESIADTETTAYLLQQDFVIFGLAAIALLGLLSGAIGPFIIMRQMSFSVHGASELALTGAAAALLFALEGAFLTAAAFLATSATRTPAARAVLRSVSVSPTRNDRATVPPARATLSA